MSCALTIQTLPGPRCMSDLVPALTESLSLKFWICVILESLVSLALGIVCFFFNWYVTEQGLEWFSGVIFRSDFQEWFSWPVLWQQHGVTLQHVPDPPHWKHWAVPSLVPQSSHSPAEPNPALASPAWPIPAARAASRAISTFECLLEVPAQWLPTGTGDQICESIS